MSQIVAGPQGLPPYRWPDRLRLVGASAVMGPIVGVGSAVFLESLRWVSERQGSTSWLLWCLPLAGAVVAGVQHRWGGRAVGGTRLALSQIRSLDDGVPLRLAPLAVIGTLITHLFGGSAGREGTALQMAAGLTDGIAERIGPRLGWTGRDRQLLLIVALAAGFGSVFGVPWAGMVFAVEVAPTGWRRRVDALAGCGVASLLADAVVDALGVSHSQFPTIGGVGVSDVVWVGLAAPLFGLCAWMFIVLTDEVRDRLAAWRGAVERQRTLAPWAPLVAPVIGGLAVIALTLLLGTRDYNGLSLPLIDRSLSAAQTGIEVGLAVWLAKLVMTSLTVGSGFPGGEVTPLFVMGATLGSALGSAVGGPVALLAAVGMMATFGSAVNAPIACVVMGIELFGSGAAVPLAVGCALARLCSSGRSLYRDHRVPAEAEFV